MAKYRITQNISQRLDAQSISGYPVSGSPSDGQVLQYDSTTGGLTWVSGSLAGGTITTTGGNIELAPTGSGIVVIDSLSWPSADGSDGQILTTDGSGNLSFSDPNAVVAAEGAMAFTSAAETTISAADTPVKAAGTTTAYSGNVNFTHTNNRLTYSGDATTKMLVNCTVTMSAATLNDIVRLLVYKNGAAVSPYTGISRKLGTGDDRGAMAITKIIEMTTDDYVEVWVENLSGSGNVTIDEGNVTVIKV